MLQRVLVQLLAILSMLALPATMHYAYATSLEDNLKKLNLPDGFAIEIYADDVPGARTMVLGQSTGTVFVGTREDKVYAVVDKDKDRKAEKVVTILEDLKVPNGLALHQGMLYVAEQHRIVRYPAPGFSLDLPFTQMGEVVYDQLPDKAHHGWRYIEFGPDEKLYVTVGVACNICDFKDPEGTILQMNPDGSNANIFASGHRNSVGMAFHPVTDVLHFTDNNTDMMGDDIPPGEFNAAPESGMHFGFPYYAGGSIQHKDWKNKKPPQKVTFPLVEFPAHAAALGVEFYNGKMLPKKYKNTAFVAQHGSWNRSKPIGYRLVHIDFNDKGEVTGDEVFVDGWLQNGEAWGRPVDLLQLPDGSLLVSDDYQGVIYRIYYEG